MRMRIMNMMMMIIKCENVTMLISAEYLGCAISYLVFILFIEIELF